MSLFARGVVFGLAIAAPVGPIGVLVIRRTLVAGLRQGLATGLGAATADGCYGLLAGLGVTAVADLATRYHTPVGVIGAVVLVGLGIRIAVTRPRPAAPGVAGPDRLRAAYFSTIALTLANPATVLSFTAAFAGLTAGTGGRGAGLVVAAGVAVGSALWWLGLTGVIARAGRGAGPRLVGTLNVASGVVLALLGVVAGVRAV